MITLDHKKWDLPNYPEKVLTFIYEKIVPVMKEFEKDVAKDRGDIPTNAPDEVFFAAAVNTFGKNIFQNFINDGELIMRYETDEAALEAMGLFIACLDLMHLKHLGLTDSIQDENGEDIFFLTQKGKIIGEELQNEKQ